MNSYVMSTEVGCIPLHIQESDLEDLLIAYL